MNNQEVAKIFYEMANYLEMDEVAFKPYAYRRAALAIESLEEDVADIYKKGGTKALMEIPGVGKNIANHIKEYLKIGKVKQHEAFRKRLPINMEELISVEGMGPKKAKKLYRELGIKDLKGLERAAKSHKIALLFSFGAKTEKNILESIAFLKRSKGRFLLGEILPQVKEIQQKLKDLKWVQRVDLAGSTRRMKETIGDADLLITLKPAFAKASAGKIMDFFVSLPGVVKVWGKGATKASVRMEEGFDIDVRVVPKKSYGSALQYFTGSKEHNIATRRIAIDKGLKLSEYGLFRGKKMIAGENEEGIYKILGLQWMPPEIREDQGEIEAALRQAQGKLPGLPKLIGYQDIKGDLHVHEKDSSIEELVKVAQDMGYEYIGISDHTKALHIEHGLNEEQLIRRNKRIDKINWKLSRLCRRSSMKSGKIGNCKLRILKGVEANIMPDGSIDIKDDVLAQMDYVIAGVHSSLKMPKNKMTERMIKAMANRNVDIISHPTGRILKQRDEYQIDFDKILKAAKETGTILEVSAWPDRLDLNCQNVRRAKEAGIKMVINTDSHRKDQLRFMEFGIAQARRGWAEKDDIINSQPLKKLLTYFKK